MKKLQIAVIGSAGNEEYPFGKPDQSMFKVAEEIGKLLASEDCVVVSGGKGGIMEAVSRGAKSANGMTVAEVAGDGRGEANEYVDIEIVTTDIGFRGPSTLIGMSDAVLALGGGAGTLQEIAVAYRMQKPIVLLKGFGGWVDKLDDLYLDERQLVPFMTTKDYSRAVKLVVDAAKKERNNER